jgi:AcrR family transcriptional regulator
MAKPRKNQSETTQSRIIEAADALLHQYGYMGTSMDAIAERIGIRKASLYHHFPDGKDQIMLEIGERLIEYDRHSFQNALETSGTVREKLEAMADFNFKDTRQTNRVLRDAMRFMPTEHQQRLSAQFFSAIFDPVHAVLNAGVASGELRSHDTRFSAFTFLSLLSEMNEPQQQTTWDDLPQKIVSLMIDGLKN